MRGSSGSEATAYPALRNRLWISTRRKVSLVELAGASTGNNSGQRREDRQCQVNSDVAAAIALLAASQSAAGAGQRVAAQSAGMFVNAVDLDIVPAERDNFLAAIKENGAAAAKEPGCRRFDILNLAQRSEPFPALRSLRQRGRLQGAPRDRSFQEIRGGHGQNGRQARRPADVGHCVKREVMNVRCAAPAVASARAGVIPDTR